MPRRFSKPCCACGACSNSEIAGRASWPAVLISESFQTRETSSLGDTLSNVGTYDLYYLLTALCPIKLADRLCFATLAFLFTFPTPEPLNASP
jgi:hypothetical protein